MNYGNYPLNINNNTNLGKSEVYWISKIRQIIYKNDQNLSKNYKKREILGNR